MHQAETPVPVMLGEFRFDPRSHELTGHDGSSRLPRRLSSLLWFLVRAAPDVVSRQQLLDEVWQRRIVEDDVLSRAIAELRKVLGDDNRAPRYIETIPKAGYRLVASVVFDPEGAASSAGVDGVSDVGIVEPSGDEPDASRRARTPMASWFPLASLAILALVAMAGWRSWTAPRTSALAPFEASATVADMAAARPFTSGEGWEYWPDISADGQWVAYSESGPGDDGNRLVLQDIEGLHREVLEAGARFNSRPAFSPDGSQLAFLHVDSERRCSLRLRSIPGRTGRKIADCSAEVSSAPAWSPDQERLVFTSPAHDGKAPGLSWVHLASGTIESLTQPGLKDGADRDPEWIPKTNAITFARGPDGEQHLMRLDLDDPDRRPRTLLSAGRLQGHAWRPDAEEILVATDQPGYRTLVRFSADGERIEVLGARGARYPAWARNGELIFESAQFNANIWRIDWERDGAQPIAVVQSTRYDTSPTLADAVPMLGFVSTRNDFEQVFVADLDGANPQRLPMPDGNRWSRPAFKPDASTLLVTGYDQRSLHAVYRYDRATARTERLDELGPDASAARYSDDGAAMLYVRRMADNTRQLWRIDANLGSPPVVIAGSAGVDQFALSGGLLVITRIDRDGFDLLEWQQPSAWRTVLRGVHPISQTAWTLRGRNLYAVVRDGQRNALKRWNVDNGRDELLAVGIDADAVGPSLVVDATQSKAWFARTDSLRIDLMRVPAKDKGAVQRSLD